MITVGYVVDDVDHPWNVEKRMLFLTILVVARMGILEM